jgi:predicted RNA binding protein YcfA (HicA-like mRNA interferase family)
VPKLPRPSGKEMVAFLERRGFDVVRIRGSHFVLQKDYLKTTVPVHRNDPLRIGALRGILRDVEMSPDEFSLEWGI